jgi:hypothetical protein
MGSKREESGKVLNTLEYKGKSYPVRLLNLEYLKGEGEGRVKYRIASEELSDAFGEDIDEWDDVAQAIDQTVYMYLEPDKFRLSGKEIAESHLDIPFKFLYEEAFGFMETE